MLSCVAHNSCTVSFYSEWTGYHFCFCGFFNMELHTDLFYHWLSALLPVPVKWTSSPTHFCAFSWFGYCPSMVPPGSIFSFSLLHITIRYGASLSSPVLVSHLQAHSSFAHFSFKCVICRMEHSFSVLQVTDGQKAACSMCFDGHCLQASLRLLSGWHSAARICRCTRPHPHSLPQLKINLQYNV